jgi:3,4-dihydroxy 2-butanone 4-phosphate synthase/GTP cyclohydrolase II
MPFGTVEEAASELRSGKPVLLVGDWLGHESAIMVAAAESIEPEVLELMAAEARGTILVVFRHSRLQQLGLVALGSAVWGDDDFPALSVHLKGSYEVTLAEHARTIQALCAETTRAADLQRPGHVFPRVSHDWGVLARPRHVEGSVDLTEVAGRFPGAVITSMLGPGGRMMSLGQAAEVAHRNRLRAVRIDDLVTYRWRTARAIEPTVTAHIPVREGHTFNITPYRCLAEDRIAVVLQQGKVKGAAQVPFFLHRQSIAADVFASRQCTCWNSLQVSLATLAAAPAGILVYLVSDELGSLGLDHGDGCPKPFDQSELGLAAQVLHDLEPASVAASGLREDERAVLKALFGR